MTITVISDTNSWAELITPIFLVWNNPTIKLIGTQYSLQVGCHCYGDKINVLGRAETNIQTDEKWSPWKWNLWLNGNMPVWVRACVHIRSVTDNVHKNGRISALDYKPTSGTYNKIIHTKGIFQVLIGVFLIARNHTVKSNFIYWWMVIRNVKVIYVKNNVKSNNILSQTVYRLQWCTVCLYSVLLWNTLLTAVKFRLLIHVKSKNYINFNSHLRHFCKIIFR